MVRTGQLVGSFVELVYTYKSNSEPIDDPDPVDTSAVKCPQCGRGRMHPLMIVHRFWVICKEAWHVGPALLDTS